MTVEHHSPDWVLSTLLASVWELVESGTPHEVIFDYLEETFTGWTEREKVVMLGYMLMDICERIDNQEGQDQ